MFGGAEPLDHLEARRRTPRSLLPFLFLLLLVPIGPASALDEAGLQEALRRGRRAKQADEVPALVQVGRLQHEGETYRYFVGTCRHWLANLAYVAQLGGEELDPSFLRRRCLDRDELRVAVSASAAPGLQHEATPPAPTPPVINLTLQLDGRELRLESPADFARYGVGNAFGTFGPAEIEPRTELMITAHLADGHSLSLKVAGKRLRPLR